MPDMNVFTLLALLAVGGATTWLAYQNWTIAKDAKLTDTNEARVAVIMTAALTGTMAGAAVWAFTASQNPQLATVTHALANLGMGTVAAVMATSLTIIARRYTAGKNAQ